MSVRRRAGPPLATEQLDAYSPSHVSAFPICAIYPNESLLIEVLREEKEKMEKLLYLFVEAGRGKLFFHVCSMSIVWVWKMLVKKHSVYAHQTRMEYEKVSLSWHAKSLQLKNNIFVIMKATPGQRERIGKDARCGR